MEIKIIKPDGTEVEQLEREYNDPGTVTGDNDGEIDHIATKQVLDLDRDDNSYDDDISILVKWAKSNGAKEPLDIKWAIRDLRMRLGTPTYGDSIKHLTRFAYLDLEEKKIKKEKESFR